MRRRRVFIGLGNPRVCDSCEPCRAVSNDAMATSTRHPQNVPSESRLRPAASQVKPGSVVGGVLEVWRGRRCLHTSTEELVWAGWSCIRPRERRLEGHQEDARLGRFAGSPPHEPSTGAERSRTTESGAATHRDGGAQAGVAVARRLGAAALRRRSGADAPHGWGAGRRHRRSGEERGRRARADDAAAAVEGGGRVPMQRAAPLAGSVSAARERRGEARALALVFRIAPRLRMRRQKKAQRIKHTRSLPAPDAPSSDASTIHRPCAQRGLAVTLVPHRRRRERAHMHAQAGTSAAHARSAPRGGSRARCFRARRQTIGGGTRPFEPPWRPRTATTVDGDGAGCRLAVPWGAWGPTLGATLLNWRSGARAM